VDNHKASQKRCTGELERQVEELNSRLEKKDELLRLYWQKEELRKKLTASLKSKISLLEQEIEARVGVALSPEGSKALTDNGQSNSRRQRSNDRYMYNLQLSREINSGQVPVLQRQRDRILELRRKCRVRGREIVRRGRRIRDLIREYV
jgi:hypothetical protein